MSTKTAPDPAKTGNGRTGSAEASQGRREAQPLTHQRGHETQAFGTVVRMPIALDESVCKASVDCLNQILVDTMTLRDMYKKHHWQVSGHTFYQLHLLFDKHFGEQAELVDSIAERIQLLGGIAVAMAPDVAELTKIPRPPRGREEVPVQISRLLEAHELILKESRAAAKKADRRGRRRHQRPARQRRRPHERTASVVRLRTRRRDAAGESRVRRTTEYEGRKVAPASEDDPDAGAFAFGFSSVNAGVVTPGCPALRSHLINFPVHLLPAECPASKMPPVQRQLGFRHGRSRFLSADRRGVLGRRRELRFAPAVLRRAPQTRGRRRPVEEGSAALGAGAGAGVPGPAAGRPWAPAGRQAALQARRGAGRRRAPGGVPRRVRPPRPPGPQAADALGPRQPQCVLRRIPRHPPERARRR